MAEAAVVAEASCAAIVPDGAFWSYPRGGVGQRVGGRRELRAAGNESG